MDTLRYSFCILTRCVNVVSAAPKLPVSVFVFQIGMPLKYPQIYEILRNEKYTGLYAYSPVQAKNRADRRAKPDSIKIENALPVIISKAQSMEVQKIMNAKKRIDEKKRQYDTLMKNIAAGVLPGEVLVDIGQQMKELKAEIAALEQTEPPKDFTVDTIRSWLESIKAAPNRDAVRLLIERIDITPEQEKEKTDFNIQSTLKSVLGKHGRGDEIRTHDLYVPNVALYQTEPHLESDAPTYQ